MKGLIAAGGKAKRLRPITYSLSKQLIPIANRPIVAFVCEAMTAAGITEVGVVISPETGDDVREALGDGSAFGARFTYIVQKTPAGLADVIGTGADFVGDDDFCFFLGDNLLQHGITVAVERYLAEGPDASILLAAVDEPSQFGVAELDGDRVVRLVEKPDDPPSDLALVGVYLGGPKLVDAARRVAPSARGELEITDALQLLIDEGADVRSEQVTGYWKDLGTTDDLLTGNRLMLDALEPRIDGTLDDTTTEGLVVVEAGAKVTGSAIVGPAIIGRDAVIHGTMIGAGTSVGDGAIVDGCRLSNSIVMNGARLVGVELQGSLVGREAQVDRGATSSRVMLGDRSVVHLP